MRWIILLIISCFFVFTGCSDNNHTNDNNPGGATDTGLEQGEDASTDSETETDSETDSDAANNESDTSQDTDPSTSCTTNEDCSGSNSVCDPMSHLCVDCLFDSQCADGGRCIERVCKTEETCESDHDCANVTGKTSCNLSLRECVASCNNSLDCDQGNVCDPLRRQCVQCASNLDCGDGERCVASQCEAFLPCQSDNQCMPYGLLCNVERGACNECENDAACPNSYHCTAGRCVVDICETDTMRCSNRNVEKCVEGKSFEVVQSCPAQEACQQEGNSASCGTCTANDQCARGFECNQGVCERIQSPNCPTAIAEARIVGTTEYNDDIRAQPLQSIELNATRSSGNSALTYEWSIIKRPTNSQARLTPNSTTDKPTLWLDLAGEYEIELVAFDADDIASCESSIVTIHAVPDQEIHIQLTWYAPAVPNPQKNNGTDLDLHYRHPQGTKWNDTVYTIWWNNKRSSPSWGNTPALANTATLDIDDLWGATTEAINHFQPLNGSYEIGVHYYNDNGYGGANANIRIYIRGELKYEILNKRMQHKQFWRVGHLQWPSSNMIWIDQVVCDTTLAGFTVAGCRP